MAFITAVWFLGQPPKSFAEGYNLIAFVTGDSVGDEFYHVALGQGDVNGDGCQDVLIGAPGGGTSGYAKLFFGGAHFDTIPDLIFHGEEQPYFSSDFGYGCAFIGDVNSDGFDDIVIGAPGRSISWIYQGAAYLYFGGVEMDTLPDLSFYGEYWYHGLGANVSGAADVNGDGYDDWLINAPFDDIYALGRIYLYYGSAEPDSICDVYFEGLMLDQLSFDSPMLGDINGDSYDDLIFGGVGVSENGFIQIHLGSAQMDTVPDLQWLGTPGSWNDLRANCGVGDVNEDGYNDWLIQSSQMPSYFSLYFGCPQPDTIPDLLFSPEAPCTGIGNPAGGGDINADEFDDIVMGGSIFSGTYVSGQILGYQGGPCLDNYYDYFYDSGVNNYLGSTVGLADVNGDGICEVLAGAAQIDWGPGQVWFFSTQVQAAPPVQNIPNSWFMFSSHPNPFNPTTILSYDLPVASHVSLRVHNTAGRLVATLIDGWRLAGKHQAIFDGSDLPSGIYLARLQAGDFTAVQKLVLMK